MNDEYNEKSEIELCDFLAIHEDAVKQVRAALPDEDSIFELAELYKIFGDHTAYASCVCYGSTSCACAT